MLHFDCQHCGKVIRLKEEFAGRKGACPHCKRPIQAPAASPPSDSLPRAKPSRPSRPTAVPQPVQSQPSSIFDDDADTDQPVIARREKPKKKSSNPMPMLLVGGSVAGIVLIGVVIWLVTSHGSGSGSNAPAPSGPSGPSAAAPTPKAGAPPGAAAPSLGGGSQPPAVSGTNSKADLFAYMPQTIETIACAHVAEAMKAQDKIYVKPQLDATLRPVVSKCGLKVDDIDDVVMGCGAEPDQLLMAIRTVNAVDASAIRKNLGCAEKAERINQHDLFAVPGEPNSTDSAAVFLDSKTFLLGSKALVQGVLESAPSLVTPSVLKDVTEVSGATTSLWVVAKMSVLKSQVTQLTSFGIEEGLFAPSLDKIGLVAIGFDLSRGMQLRMAIECRSEGEAKLVRGVVDTVRVALRDAEKKQATLPGGSGSEQSGGSGSPSGGSGVSGRSGPGGMPGGPGGMPGGSSGGPGGPGRSGGMPGGRSGGGPGGGMPAGGMSGGGSSGGPGGSGGPQGGSGVDRSPGAVWDASEVKQIGAHVLVTMPPFRIEGDTMASPLDLFGSATLAGFARTATGSPLFPGSLRRASQALRLLEQQEGTIPAGAYLVEKYPQPILRVSWLASLLPYLGYQELHDQISFSDEWTDKKNIPVAATIVDAFLDPMVPMRRWKGPPLEGVALTHFVGMGGIGDEGPRLPKEHPKAGIFGYNRKTALADIRDGVSNTIMLIQARDVFGPWIQGGGATVRAAQSRPYIGVTSGFGSPGDAGVMTIFADGSVRFLSKDIDPAVFEALCTINGGETVDLSQLPPGPR